MKIQDVIFLVTAVVLIFQNKPKLGVTFGLFSLILSIPLFYLWIFFTAERLVTYAFFFFLISIVSLMIGEIRKTVT